MASQPTKFCQNCGSSVMPENKFCQGCGQPVAPSEAFSETPVPAQATERPQRMDRIFHQAQQIDPADRDAFLIAVCQDDVVLLQELRDLLKAPPSNPSAPLTAPTLRTQPAALEGERRERMKRIFYQAEQVEPSARDEFLAASCSGDTLMLRDLREMLSTAPTPSAPRAHDAGSASEAPTIGVYRVIRELGRGGMGVVYLAVRDDGAFRKNVALKLLLRECVTAEFISRFKQERQVLAALDHPNIARILDGGDTYDGMPYYVMEYVEGMPLDRYCDQQRLSLKGRIKIFQQVCLAVNYLHQNSILHRDLKPSNILVSSEGVVKLLDFGIAKVVGAGSYANQELTTAQGRPMTPTYASPEQLEGGTLQKTSDLYSLGAILYTLLTGRSAYNDLDDKLSKIAARELPTKPSLNIREDLRSEQTTAQFRRAMMGELDSIVLMAMQIDPKHRYQSADDLAQDLQHFLDGSPVTAYHVSAAGRSVKLLRRKAAAIAVVLGFLILGTFGAWQWYRLQSEKARQAEHVAQLNKLVDQFEARLTTTQTSGSAPPVEDVRQLRDAFQKLTPGSQDASVLEKGLKYLDHFRAVAPANPALEVQMGDAYQILGNLQEVSSLPSQTVLATYQKAAATLVNAGGSGAASESLKRHLANVNARIQALGGTAIAEPVTNATENSQPIVAQAPAETPAATEAHAKPIAKKPAAEIPSATPVEITTAPSAPVSTATPTVSAEIEDQLESAEAKVKIADETIAPIRQSLEQQGQTLNAETLSRLTRMHSTLDRAKRAIAAGNEAGAKENLSIAEALAGKLLESVGR